MFYLLHTAILLLRIILKVFQIFPICENRIVFTCYYGKQYSCNPKYIFEYIYNNYGSIYQYVWFLNDKKLFPKEYKDVKIINYLSLKYFWYSLTSKYFISNVQIEPFLPIRRKQIFINTWHGGGAYKKVSVSSLVYRMRRQFMITQQKIRAKQTSYSIASCEKFKKFMSKDWEIPESKFIPIGMPRNDIFFSNYIYKDKIAKYYNINQKQSIILYAPTFRGVRQDPKTFKFTLKIEELLSALEKKFKKEYVFLFREHHFFNSERISDKIIFATDYPDMQELLCATDILITDYSSSIWDFSLSYKPCFLYVPDLMKYKNEQGFYTPIEDWPFPLAETNEQLIDNIFHFDDEKYKQAVKQHHINLGSYENGKACEQFYRFLFINNKNGIVTK